VEIEGRGQRSGSREEGELKRGAETGAGRSREGGDFE
jgi:hypothetical protein